MVDLEADRKVLTSEAKEYAEQRKMEYIEVSSKTGQNVQKLLEMITLGAQVATRTD
jgi:translation initiation factor IF-2